MTRRGATDAGRAVPADADAIGIEIAPSVLSADHAQLGDQVVDALAAGARRIHIDVMDGHFVPNLGFGPGTVAALAPLVHEHGGMVECHLMMYQPDPYLGEFSQAGADLLTVHVEACPQLHRTVAATRSAGAAAGVALSPATPVVAVEEILPAADLILVMTVDPGFGAQQLIAGTLHKVTQVAAIAAESRPGLAVEVDGGMDEATVRDAAAAGATVAVAGSAIFDASRPVAACMAAMRAAARKARPGLQRSPDTSISTKGSCQ
jgi:ribulose-phosphate 3-epimerase